MKKLFLALVCMVTLMAVTSCGGTATPTAAADEGLEMIKAGNYEGFVETIYFGEKATEEEVKQAKEIFMKQYLKDHMIEDEEHMIDPDLPF